MFPPSQNPCPSMAHLSPFSPRKGFFPAPEPTLPTRDSPSRDAGPVVFGPAIERMPSLQGPSILQIVSTLVFLLCCAMKPQDPRIVGAFIMRKQPSFCLVNLSLQGSLFVQGSFYLEKAYACPEQCY